MNKPLIFQPIQMLINIFSNYLRFVCISYFETTTTAKYKTHLLTTNCELSAGISSFLTFNFEINCYLFQFVIV